MNKVKLIAINDFCNQHNIDLSFIGLLQNTGLIDITTIKETVFIDSNQLRQLEKIVRLRYEMDINLEGIETIFHLLNRIYKMQDEINLLKNMLRLYETEF